MNDDNKPRSFDFKKFHPTPVVEGQPIPDSMFGLVSDEAMKKYVADYINNLPDSDIAIRSNKSNTIHKYDISDSTLKPIDIAEQITSKCQEAYDERDTAKKETRMYKRECERLKQQVRELMLERNNANQELDLYKKRYFEVLEKLESKN